MRPVTSNGSPSHNQHLNSRRVTELPQPRLACARAKGAVEPRQPQAFRQPCPASEAREASPHFLIGHVPSEFATGRQVPFPVKKTPPSIITRAKSDTFPLCAANA